MHPKPLFRFAHISDLHFSRLLLSPAQFFSKPWVGNLNLLINRKKKFSSSHLYTLIPLFQELKVDAVLVTGDLTTTSHDKEFEMAKKYVDAFAKVGIRVFLVPGNHDHYTRRAYRNREFYRYFDTVFRSMDDPLSFFSLKEDKIATTHLGNGWWLFAIDSAEATSLFSAYGVFSPMLEKKSRTRAFFYST